MVRMVLAAWVLISIPFSVALGRMYRNASRHRTSAGLDAGDVARMLSRAGYRPGPRW